MAIVSPEGNYTQQPQQPANGGQPKIGGGGGPNIQPPAPNFPQPPGPATSLATGPAQQARDGIFAYAFKSLDLAALVGTALSPKMIRYTGDVFAVHNLQATPASPDIWVRFDGGDYIRVIATFVWEQPFKTVEIYSGTIYAGGLLEFVLQQNGLAFRGA